MENCAGLRAEGKIVPVLN